MKGKRIVMTVMLLLSLMMGELHRVHAQDAEPAQKLQPIASEGQIVPTL